MAVVTSRRWRKLALSTLAISAFLGCRADAVPVVVIEGRGFGHGVGMAQDGAYWLAQAGQSHTQILAHFYPGTKVAKRGGTIRVPLLSGTFTAVLPQGGRVGDEEVDVGRPDGQAT